LQLIAETGGKIQKGKKYSLVHNKREEDQDKVLNKIKVNEIIRMI